MADKSLFSDGVDDESLAIAERYFAEKDAGRGPAQQMMDFAQPMAALMSARHETMFPGLHERTGGSAVASLPTVPIKGP